VQLGTLLGMVYAFVLIATVVFLQRAGAQARFRPVGTWSCVRVWKPIGSSRPPTIVAYLLLRHRLDDSADEPALSRGAAVLPAPSA